MFREDKTRSRIARWVMILAVGAFSSQASMAQVRLQGGDDIGSATVIAELPFLAAGTTVGYNDDYDFDCPESATGSPDVVYSYTPPGELPIWISLCESDFDTKVYVFMNEPSNVLACSDDDCGTDGNRSVIFDLMLEPANTYYIIVDGHGGSQGNYNIEIGILPPDCNLQPPPNAVIEDEPWCYDGYVDTINAGCQQVDVWDTIQVNSIFCGTSGTFLLDGLEYRDTDWLEFDLTDSTAIELEGIAEFDLLMVIIRQGSVSPCIDYELLQWGVASFCSPLTIYAELGAGRYWAWAATSEFVGVECGRKYILELRPSGGPSCDYIPGDINNNGDANGVDVTYAVNYLKGVGPQPIVECPDCPNPGESLFAAGDVNANCIFNGVDVTYFVNYLKGIGPALGFCASCPPAEMAPAARPIDSLRLKTIRDLEAHSGN